jgi:hypothetical protein
MKSSPLITLILTVASIGLSLPARADKTVINESNQTTVISGSNNTVNQSNNTTISERGNRGGNNGTTVRNRQNADIVGDGNTVKQTNRTEVENRRQNR